MDRKLLLKIFETADARHDPCGAAAFAERLGHELDAGRIVFPIPLPVGGALAYGWVVLDRCPAPDSSARTLVRALADLVDGPGACVGVEVCGNVRPEVFVQVTREAGRELAGRTGIGLLIMPAVAR